MPDISGPPNAINRVWGPQHYRRIVWSAATNASIKTYIRAATGLAHKHGAFAATSPLPGGSTMGSRRKSLAKLARATAEVCRFEALECRQLLTTLSGGDTFDFKDSENDLY